MLTGTLWSPEVLVPLLFFVVTLGVVGCGTGGEHCEGLYRQGAHTPKTANVPAPQDWPGPCFVKPGGKVTAAAAGEADTDKMTGTKTSKANSVAGINPIAVK